MREVPEFGMGYGYVRRGDAGDKITVLLHNDRDSMALRAQVVESKGAACEEAVDTALRGICEFGHPVRSS